MNVCYTVLSGGTKSKKTNMTILVWTIRISIRHNNNIISRP